MKTDNLNLTREELDELCRLYMDCRLSVLEEKELEYILLNTSVTSPSIEEVRSLVQIATVRQYQSRPRPRRKWLRLSGIAAGVAATVSAALYLATPPSALHTDDRSEVYVVAYSNGRLLDNHDAVVSTDMAMAKADSLMNYASLMEHAYMQKSKEIISKTNY